MKNLTDLNLRNALITCTIPADIGDLSSLNMLDLSFNLTGPVPGGLFNEFLGNNSLTGDLPSRKSAMLQTIDLSYNFLSGSFPSWVSSSLQLNFVVNNFTFDRSNISVLPGLNCLQRGFVCNRNPPLYAWFAINSGGDQLVSADGTVYEAKSASLGAASFNVTSTKKWAVSNAGLYVDRQNPTYNVTYLHQVSRTNTLRLFQSSRSSAGFHS